MILESLIPVIVIAIIILALSIFIVPQNTAAIVERFGRFLKVAKPGLHFKIPIIDKIAKRESLRIQELIEEVDSKTKDNVFVSINISAQYKIPNDEEMIYKAYYELQNPREQISSYLFDVVRAEIPKMTLDEVFEKKDDIAKAVKKELSETIQSFGYEIVKALVTDIKVDERIIQAMNDIVASEREKLAAKEKAEAERILMVKKAEAEAESKKLQGEGIANQRKAIINGFKESVEDMTEIKGIETKDILDLILITQYFDTLKDMASSESNTIMIPATSSFNSIASQIREGIISGNIVKTKEEKEEN